MHGIKKQNTHTNQSMRGKKMKYQHFYSYCLFINLLYIQIMMIMQEKIFVHFEDVMRVCDGGNGIEKKLQKKTHHDDHW